MLTANYIRGALSVQGINLDSYSDAWVLGRYATQFDKHFDASRLNATLKCSPENKQCGGACVPEKKKCSKDRHPQTGVWEKKGKQQRIAKLEAARQKKLQKSIDLANERTNKKQAKATAAQSPVKVVGNFTVDKITAKDVAEIKGWESIGRTYSQQKGLDADTVFNLKAIGVYTDDIVDDTESHAVKDTKGKIQAAMKGSIKDGAYYVDSLATAPHNLIAGHPDGVRGAGTSAIIQAIKLSKQAGHDGVVRLQAARRAIPFYKKLGFAVSHQEDDAIEMTLAGKEANSLLSLHSQAAQANPQATAASKPVSNKKVLTAQDVKTPQDKVAFAEQELEEAKKSGDKSRVKAWEKELKSAQGAVLKQAQVGKTLTQTSLFDPLAYDNTLPLMQQLNKI